MILQTSWDDGSLFDTKIAHLLTKYKLPGTFYIPTQCELQEHTIKELSEHGFIIGAHTENHPQDLKKLTIQEQTKEIKSNKKYLEKIIGKPVTSFCYPRGRYDERTIAILQKLGFTEARTTVVNHTDVPIGAFQKHTTIHAYPDRVEYNGQHWLIYAKALFKMATLSEHGYYHLWGHSWEIEKFDLWDELEELLKYMSAND